MTKQRVIIAVFFSLLLSGNALAVSLTIKNVWIPEAPPTSRMLAGYMTVTNNTDQEILIEEVASPSFGMIEMHRSVYENGMAKMIWQPHVHVPVGKVIKLEPGGKHLMLMKPRKQLKAGDKVEFTLHLSNNQTQTVTATVRK